MLQNCFSSLVSCEKDLRDGLIADDVGGIRFSSCSSSLGFGVRDLRDGLIADHVGN